MNDIRNMPQEHNMVQDTMPDSAEMSAQSSYAAHYSKCDERHFCISVAGCIIGINSIYTGVYDLCHDYLCEEEPDIQINIYEEDLEFEKSKADDAAVYSESYLETLAAYRKISKAILDYNTFLMHGAVIAYENESYMFTAASGTGKTTHIRLWLENLAGSYVVNGDKPLIKITKNEAIACGTPWCGKENLGRNCMVPLKAIIFMERGEDNEIHEISFEQALGFLMKQTYMPREAESMKKTLTLLAMLKGRVKFYKYVFNNMKSDAFEVAYGIIAKKHNL